MKATDVMNISEINKRTELLKEAIAKKKQLLQSGHKASRFAERMLILFAALSGLWFLLFDVYPPNDSIGSFAVVSLFWAFMFVSSIAVHLVALACDSPNARIAACLYHSIIWGMWTLIAFTSTRPTMATPLVFGLAIMAFYEAFRLRPKNND